jgi:hypothetical protein
MLVLVATKSGQRFPNKDVFKCGEGEIVRFGLLQDHHNRTGRDNTMRGITSMKETTTVKIQDLKIDEEFYYEVIKDSIEAEFGIEVESNGIFIIEIGPLKQKFNLKEIVVDLLFRASKKRRDRIYRIDGRTLLEDIEINIPIVVERKSRKRKKDGEESSKESNSQTKSSGTEEAQED